MKVSNKLETETERVFKGVGMSASGMKFFFNKANIAKDAIFKSLDIKEGDLIICVEGLGKPSTFKRFLCGENLSKYWANCGRYSDGICFVPN